MRYIDRIDVRTINFAFAELERRMAARFTPKDPATAAERRESRSKIGVLAASTTAQFDKTDNTLEAIPGLVMVLLAGATYQVSANLRVAASSPGGLRIALGGSVVVSSHITNWFNYDNTLGDFTGCSLNVDPGLFGGLLISSASSPDNFVSIVSTISVNTTGTISVKFAQDTTDAAASVVQIGSTLTAVEI